jgi:hypothetical protein
MSDIVLRFLHCDHVEIHEDGPEYCYEALRVYTLKVKETRRETTKAGWTHLGESDYCPRHSQGAIR